MTWVGGVCSKCDRETDVVHVDEHGQMCIVCLDLVTENNEEVAR